MLTRIPYLSLAGGIAVGVSLTPTALVLLPGELAPQLPLELQGACLAVSALSLLALATLLGVATVWRTATPDADDAARQAALCGTLAGAFGAALTLGPAVGVASQSRVLAAALAGVQGEEALLQLVTYALGRDLTWHLAAVAGTAALVGLAATLGARLAHQRGLTASDSPARTLHADGWAFAAAVFVVMSARLPAALLDGVSRVGASIRRATAADWLDRAFVEVGSAVFVALYLFAIGVACWWSVREGAAMWRAGRSRHASVALGLIPVLGLTWATVSIGAVMLPNAHRTSPLLLAVIGLGLLGCAAAMDRARSEPGRRPATTIGWRDPVDAGLLVAVVTLPLFAMPQTMGMSLSVGTLPSIEPLMGRAALDLDACLAAMPRVWWVPALMSVGWLAGGAGWGVLAVAARALYRLALKLAATPLFARVVGRPLEA